jgi:hypothetical protein
MQVIRSIRNLTLSALPMIALVGTLPCVSFAQISVGVGITMAPPELPVYEQPLCPQPITCGLRDIGHGVFPTVTTGFRERGSWLLQ